jgi:hypothetical protein
MDTEQFWISVWALLAAATVILAFVISGYVQSQDKKVLEMVLNGADPIEAACSMHDVRGNNPACIAIVTRRQ